MKMVLKSIALVVILNLSITNINATFFRSKILSNIAHIFKPINPITGANRLLLKNKSSQDKLINFGKGTLLAAVAAITIRACSSKNAICDKSNDLYIKTENSSKRRWGLDLRNARDDFQNRDSMQYLMSEKFTSRPMISIWFNESHEPQTFTYYGQEEDIKVYLKRGEFVHNDELCRINETYGKGKFIIIRNLFPVMTKKGYANLDFIVIDNSAQNTSADYDENKIREFFKRMAHEHLDREIHAKHPYLISGL